MAPSCSQEVGWQPQTLLTPRRRSGVAEAAGQRPAAPVVTAPQFLLSSEQVWVRRIFLMLLEVTVPWQPASDRRRPRRRVLARTCAASEANDATGHCAATRFQVTAPTEEPARQGPRSKEE
jgi:hypothetical protein